MGIIDIQNPDLTTAIDTPQGFAVTPGKQDIDHGSETPGVAAVGGAAFRQGHSVVAAASSEWIPDYVEDGFHMWDAIKGTKYERHWRSFVPIRNTQAAEVMKRRIDRDEEDRRILKAAPTYVSVPMQLLAAGSDPLNWVPGGVFVRGMMGGISIVRSARSVGKAAAASTTAQELTLHAFQPTREVTESATNIGASVFFGGLIGAVGAKLLKNAEWKRSVAALDRDTYGYPAVATGDGHYKVTDNGRRFVTLEDGSDVFGRITSAIAREAGLESGAIRLPEGFQTLERGGGELHIAAKRGPESRELGHKDAAEFVKSVTSDFNEIYQHDRGSIMLVKRNGNASVAGVTLKRSDQAGQHWEVITGGEFRQSYLNNKELLWSRPRQGDATQAAAHGNTPGVDDDAAASAGRLADAAAGSTTVREVAVGTPDNGVSSTYGGRTGDAAGARAERPRQETDTGAGHAAGREGQAADRAGPEDVAGRDNRGGATGGRRGAGEAPPPGVATHMADPGGARPDADGASRVGADPGGSPVGRAGGPDEAGHGGVESPAAATEKEITAAGPPQGPPEQPGGINSTSKSEGAALEAASSRQERALHPNEGLFTTTTNEIAAAQTKIVDDRLAAHPDAGRNAASWSRMVAHVFSSARVPMLSERFLRDIHGNDAAETLKRLTPAQLAAADEGLTRARAFREAYTSGEMSVARTGKLFLWSFLSRTISPYSQESMFIDAFKGIDEWLERAAAGRFTKDDLPTYKAWARSVAPSGSGQPGASAKRNLIEFGRDFLIKMSQQNADGVTHLQRLHDLLSDPNMTGQQIRREFLTFGEGSGVGNKVISLALLMAGHTDVMVLDRVQIRAMFGSGVDVNHYAGLLTGARGLLVYEAIERELAERVSKIYAATGKPDGASIGRYHWETWQAHSGQEASHETLAAILPRGNASAKALSKVRVRQGEFSAYAHGATYGVDDAGMPYYTYPKLSGGVHVFSVPAFREFLAEIKRPSSGAVKDGFRITKDGDINVPWLERQGQGIDRQKLDETASRLADLEGDVGGRVYENLVNDAMARRSDGGDTVGGGDGEGSAPAPATEKVTAIGLQQKPAGPPADTTSISEPTKSADQAALSHPEQGGPSGDPPKLGGKVRSAAAAGLAATGLGAASVNSGDDADDNATVPRVVRASQNPLERLMQSPSAAAREAASLLFDDPRSLKKRFEEIGFDASAETLVKDWNAGLSRALNGTRDAFTEHWKAAGPLDQREFNEAVGRALRNDGETNDPQVARATNLWRAQVLGPITDAAVKAGLLPDDVDPATAASYFSRTWSRGKLFAMEREFKETVAQYVAERIAREQSTGGRADVRTSAREIADDLFDMLTGRNEDHPDRRVHIPDALAAPFLEDNVELIGRRLVRRIGADLELAQKFGTPDMAGALAQVRAGYAGLRAQAMNDDARQALARGERRDIADLEAARDLIRGGRVDGPIERNYARIARAAERFDAARAAGEVGLPSLSDAVRPAMVQGLSAYMPTVDRLAADLDAVPISPGEAALAGQVAGRVLAHRLSSLAEMDDPYASQTPADAFLRKMTDTGAHGNGVRMFADMQKSLAAVMVQDRILKAVRERAGVDGLGEHMAARIAAQFEKHGEEVEGIRVANTQAWDKDDATAATLRAFRAAVNKGMGGFIAEDTSTGAAMLALKGFALASYQRLLLRGLDPKAERFVGGLIAMTAMGMFAAWTASPDVAADVERWIGEGFERSGIMAVPLELSDAFEKATDIDPLGPVKGPQTGTRLLPFNAYPSIRTMLGYALQAHN